ncbi:MAG: DUF2345 domain-containing protein, partial [Azoarcus sp.]|nr:DUF2345 domain-containing protein [Azoarcus sp.]
NEIALAAGADLYSVSQRDTQQTTGRRWIHDVGKKISLFVYGVADKVNLKLVTARGHVKLWAQSGDVEIVGDKSLLLYADKKQLLAVAKEEMLLNCGGAYIRLKGGDIEIHAPGNISVKSADYQTSGPTSLFIEPMKFPTPPMEPQPFKLDLRLHDVPGPTAHPLTEMPWKIVRPTVVDDFLAGFVDPADVLAQGVTDDKGKIVLTGEQETLLAEHYCKSPGCLWVSYSGKATQLNMEMEADDWTDEDRLMRAMSALGYADDVQAGKGYGSSPGDLERTLKAHGFEKTDAVVDKWKKGE